MKWKSRTSLVALVLVATTALNASPAQADPNVFTDRATRLVLDYVGNDARTSSIIDHRASWTVLVNGSYRLLKTDNGRCLDSNANGQAYTNPCSTSNTYQNWQIVANGSFYFLLKDRATGRCLDSNANGNVYTNPCSTSNTYQNWYH
jgi:hypothetical protein